MAKEVRMRFKDLNDEFLRNPGLYLQLYYFDDEGESIFVEDSSDLQRAYKFAELTCDNKNVLKFIVQTSFNSGIP
eukprot:CAMPEP_0202959524 /NCGR_PEP_ID=MMETSP1396-20130829/3702_1 /ASSEMBLY_ACC=CAM_ASM_000872 /TAXON_ID= /ORGANISM="Pseudokeronopsis sp., Strain Brazil" /LENGTH=74 /DNA_ID=CAMNT_0049678115 /DNA_START=325 /DNA_END=549 /DNA_ORIENTATION=+